MNSRSFMKNEVLFPNDIVDMTIELLSKVSLLDLERLILFSEMEVQYRAENGLLDEDQK